MRRTKEASQSMMGGAMILTVSMILVKVIGMLYKLPLANAYMMVGKGYFSNAFNLYSPIYAIAITGLPIAVARMVSERVALGKYNDARAIYRVARRMFLVAGAVGFFAMAALAYPYAMLFCVGDLNSLPAIFCIAPSIFFCCLMSIYRGYYEGMRNMFPTAISQVLEALCKLLLGLTLAMLVMNLGQKEFAAKGTVFGHPAASEALANSMLYPWAAAASIVGITVGTLVGSIYLMGRHIFRGDGIAPEQLRLAPPAQTTKELQKELIKVAIPIVLSSVILNVTNFIDSANVQRLLKLTVAKFPEIIQGIYGKAFGLANVVDADQPTWIWGVYNTTLDFRTLVPTIVTALGVSALPAISAAWALRKKNDVQRSINSVIRVSLMISLPAGFGMAVLAREIMTMFYENKNPGMAAHATPILALFGIFTWLMAVSGPIVSMLQGIGRTDVPVKTLLIGTAAKLGTNFLLVSNPNVNVTGAAIGTIVFFFIVVAGNLYMLLHETKTKLKLTSVLWKPLFCAVLCAAAAWAASGLVQHFGAQIGFLAGSPRMLMLAAVAVAMAAAVVVYALSMLLTKAVTADDIEFLPKGKKIGKALAKYGLLG
ncbi:MAG: polysaccharide biosynthesis protein [Oscillospiraceae bacterium]|nr:polysaccharide biosynthesis protein [Oscillospiraceae bacterium]